jgi:phosphoribosylformylglycinamidine synthase PurS subunit
MAKILVEVMLKPEILDPQGRAVKGALARQGLDGLRDVRQGKRFEIDLDDDIDLERMEQLHQFAEELLSNPVIEDYQLRVIDEGGIAP